MDVAQGLYSDLPPLGTPVVTVGGFDGVHRGHQRILAATVTWARELGGSAVVVTFEPLPKAVVDPRGTRCITSLPHRLRLLEACGIDLAAVVAFDADLEQMPPEEFVQRVLLGWLGARHVVLGRNSTFGRGGQGDLTLLRRFEAKGLLAVRSPGPVTHRGKLISSTAIRQAIAEGDLDQAAAMLGRPLSLFGTVVAGSARGRQLGFPTANLDLEHEALPPDGVYATLARLGEHAYPSLTYIGARPTFEADDAAPTVEVHIVGLDAELYGRQVDVEFVRKLRGDRRFATAEALVAQMRADREAALAALGTAERPPPSPLPRRESG